MKNFSRFLVSVFVVFLVAYIYLGWSLASSSTVGWIVLATPFAVIFSLPALMWRGRNRHTRSKDLYTHLAYSAMGLLTYLLLFTVVRDAIWALGGTEFSNLYIYLAVALALLAGALVALAGPRIKTVDVTYPHLPEELHGLRIAQITDLHIGGIVTKSYVEKVVHKANSLKADIVALTGDIGDGDASRSEEATSVLQNLEPKNRVFYVSGNHEHYWNMDEWYLQFQKIGMCLLDNASSILEFNGQKILIGGIPDKMAAQLAPERAPDLDAAIRGGDAADFKILLSHRPSPARRAAALGFDLQLSGHTHGGQFFPWTLAVRMVHEFHQGLSAVGKMWIYVSHGTGTWGPPLRLGTTPEVTLLRIQCSGEKSFRPDFSEDEP
jgi:predicted MPP superfamily phosphohydrolase